jgi:ribosomal-protein-alanine N-acetyltransferase
MLEVDDAAALASLLRDNRAFLAPWDPVREESYFTEAGQRRLILGVLVEYDQGHTVPHAILDAEGAIVGRITLSGVTRGPFQSCRLGYWVAESANGQGLATRAVGEILRLAFDELGLHRVEAGTLVHNKASQRVLERNGFVRFGLAPEYLQIAGRWQDHVMFQVVNRG